MARPSFGRQVRNTNRKKKTGQGKGRHTKYGTKNSKKYYKKRYRGQG